MKNFLFTNFGFANFSDIGSWSITSKNDIAQKCFPKWKPKTFPLTARSDSTIDFSSYSDHVDEDDDNDGILDIEDEDDDGDGIADLEVLSIYDKIG